MGCGEARIWDEVFREEKEGLPPVADEELSGGARSASPSSENSYERSTVPRGGGLAGINTSEIIQKKICRVRENFGHR